jgi:hypothetical protein
MMYLQQQFGIDGIFILLVSALQFWQQDQQFVGQHRIPFSSILFSTEPGC